MVISLSHTHTHTLSLSLSSVIFHLYCSLSHSSSPTHSTFSAPYSYTLAPLSSLFSVPSCDTLSPSLCTAFIPSSHTHSFSLSPSLSSCAIPSSYTHSPSPMILIICSFLSFSIVSLQFSSVFRSLFHTHYCYPYIFPFNILFFAFTPDNVRTKQDCLSTLINVRTSSYCDATLKLRMKIRWISISHLCYRDNRRRWFHCV